MNSANPPDNNAPKENRFLAPRRLRKIARVLPVLVPLLLLMGTALWGVDYGRHWDERNHIRAMHGVVDSGVLMPSFYHYPSVTFWLNAAALAPDLAKAWMQGYTTGDEIREQLHQALQSKAYSLRLRRIYITISSLSVLWVYLLVLAWRRSWVEALLAASFLGLSWEVGYQIRWVAPDAVMMQFGALTILCAMLSRLRPERGRLWLGLAAAAAGLGCGTKYPGGLLLVPVLVAAYQSWDGVSPRQRTRRIAEVLLIFFGVYLLTTPATLLEPFKFFFQVSKKIGHYRTAHFKYTVEAGPEHLGRMLIYFGLVFFSRYLPLAAGVFALALTGAYAVYRKSQQRGLLFFCFPVAYMLYFSLQRVMVVRNYLILAPFLAILAGRGVLFLWHRLPGRLWQSLLAALVAVILIVNAVWLVHAAASIQHRESDYFVRRAAAYIEAHPETRFFLSPQMQNEFAQIGWEAPPNVTSNPSAEADLAIFYSNEGMHLHLWPANRLGTFPAWFGTEDVNLDYYPSWREFRILMMPMEHARRLGVQAVMPSADPQ